MNAEIKIQLTDCDEEMVERYNKIFIALIRSGGLSGVKGGQTIIHFDGEGNFRGIQLSYWTWKQRKKLSTDELT
jgi:hypothetical protein